jgi:hypothetical protein
LSRSDEAAASPLASALFGINGVKTVFLGSDFVSITKTDDADWAVLKPQALAAIMDHFVSGAPVIADVAKAEAPAIEDDIAYDGETAEIVAEIKELIATRVRPAVANDGGDIILQALRRRYRHRPSVHARRLLGLSVLHAYAEAGRRKPAAPLCAGGHRRRGDAA